MTLKEIAVRNLLRGKTKALFVLAGLVIGVATVVAVVTFSDAVTGDINMKLEKYGANILIVPETESLSLNYGGVSLGGVNFKVEEIEQEKLSLIEGIKNAKNVAAVGPIVLGVTEAAGQKVLLAGVDFEASKVLKPWWRVFGEFPEDKELMIGSEAAKLLGPNLGDVMRLEGRDFWVSGILKETGSQDDHLIFTTLGTSQEVLKKPGKVSMVEVAALCHGCPVDEMVRQISEVIPGAKVMAIQQVVKGRMEALSQFKTFSMGISGVVVLVGSLVVLVTMMASVRERTKEIGVFRAVGFRKSHVMKIVFIEASILSSLAGILGFLLGNAGARAIFGFFIENPEPHAHYAHLNFHLAGAAVALAFVVGIVASIYPALAASRMDPVQALKTI